METIQDYRPALSELARLQETKATADIELPHTSLGVIPAVYFERKRIATFRLASGSHFLDLRSVETHAALRTILAAELLAAGYGGAFNFGEIIGTDYVVTQRIAGWAFDQGYGGIVYPSAHNHTSSCWSIFDRVEIVPLGAPEIIHRDDPDLLAAAALFGLTLPE
jgi:hypothetical protein